MQRGKKGRGKEEEKEGVGKGEMVPHFLVQSDASVNQWYTYEKNTPSDT